MATRRAAGALAATLALAVLTTGAPGIAQSPGPRVVAVGDIHGSLDGLTGILTTAGLIDANGRWSGGTAHLVQTGDYLDRGDKVRDVLEMLMRLETEAKRSGGRAEILLGNHEVMNLLNDLRDASPKAIEAFADDKSAERQERAYKDYERLMKRAGMAAVSREEWNAAHPPGYVEYVEALGPRARYGKWLRERKVVIEDGGTIFMHAGLTEDTTGSLEDVNRQVRADLESWDRAREMLVEADRILPFFTLRETLDAIGAELKRIATALETKQPVDDHVTREFVEAIQAAGRIGTSSLLHERGPMWFRGFAEWPDEEGAKVQALLDRFKAERFVTGHTPIVKGISSRFEHRVFLIDTGMLESTYKGGRPSALEIAGDTVTAIYLNGREVLAQPVAKE